VIVTAEHTVRRDEEITVTLPDGRTLPATLAGRDAGTDIAVLKADCGDLPAAEAAPGDVLKPGHIVLAVGRGEETGVSAAMGVISGVAGAWRTWRGGMIERFVRLDVALYPGASGGAVVDTQGRLIGLATGGLSRVSGIAIPLETLERVAGELLTRGRVTRGYLGVGLQPVALPDHLRDRLGIAGRSGVIVLSVEAGGPADNAGILVGDILVGLDGKPVTDTDDVQAALGADAVGRSIRASLVRGGEKAEATVNVRERPRREA
jgi:S1-C subfamily serine protease